MLDKLTRLARSKLSSYEAVKPSSRTSLFHRATTAFSPDEKTPVASVPKTRALVRSPVYPGEAGGGALREIAPPKQFKGSSASKRRENRVGKGRGRAFRIDTTTRGGANLLARASAAKRCKNASETRSADSCRDRTTTTTTDIVIVPIELRRTITIIITII